MASNEARTRSSSDGATEQYSQADSPVATNAPVDAENARASAGSSPLHRYVNSFMNEYPSHHDLRMTADVLGDDRVEVSGQCHVSGIAPLHRCRRPR